MLFHETVDVLAGICTVCCAITLDFGRPRTREPYELFFITCTDELLGFGIVSDDNSFQTRNVHTYAELLDCCDNDALETIRD